MIGILFTACALATVPGTLELALLTAAAARTKPPRGPRPPVDGSSLRIVIPAHDEEHGIDATLEHVLARLPSGMSPREVLVVADNCTDATAAVARRHGVRVIERQVSKSRGKGHALNEAFTQLLQHDPGAERFLVLDADARLGPSAIDELLSAFDQGAAAVQASYRVADPDLDARSGLLNLAWLCFNHLRPLGRQRLGLSVGILGNGFGLTRDVLVAVPYRAGSVVEDLEYHLRLVEAGFAVRFVPTARVLAAAAPTAGAERTQRVRWEGGRLRMLIDHLPRLVGQVLRGKKYFVEPALELALLPLALHGTLLALGIASGGLGSMVAGVGLAVLALHVLAGAFLAGRGSRDLLALAHAPAHVARKLALLPAIVRGSARTTSWKRTDRAA
jgi:cellulose synthase/poly-beta-1,6-N-acetylglucosamine synthase-like glycosyltransferase